MAWMLLLVLPLVASFVLCRLLIAISVRDEPDGERKLQPRPVPTAGGLAILIAMAVPLVAFGLLSGAAPLDMLTGLISQKPYGGWVLFVLGLGAIGLADDGFSLPALIKLVLLAGACLAVATQLPAVDLALPWAVTGDETDPAGLPAQLMLAGLALWLLVFVNATNFMDGADGLAFGSLAIMLAGLGIGLGAAYRPMLEFVDTRTWAVLLTPAIAVMAIAGFLAWNLRGLLYAGDTGALALGGLFAVMGAYTAAHLGIWYPLVLALPFLVDVGLTLLYRTLRGQNPLKAHREHAYQLFIRRGASPVRVAALWWSFCLLCLAAAVSILWLAPTRPAYGALLFTGLALFGALLWTVQRFVLRERPATPQAAPVRLSPEQAAAEPILQPAGQGSPQ